MIGEQCPDYLPAFDRVMGRTWGHMFNMFVMSADKCDAYCAWLFPILEELEGRISNMSTRGIALSPGQTLADLYH